MLRRGQLSHKSSEFGKKDGCEGKINEFSVTLATIGGAKNVALLAEDALVVVFCGLDIPILVAK